MKIQDITESHDLWDLHRLIALVWLCRGARIRVLQTGFNTSSGHHVHLSKAGVLSLASARYLSLETPTHPNHTELISIPSIRQIIYLGTHKQVVRSLLVILKELVENGDQMDEYTHISGALLTSVAEEIGIKITADIEKVINAIHAQIQLMK